MSKYTHKAGDEVMYGNRSSQGFFFLKLILMFKDGKLQLDQSGQLGSTAI